MHIIRLDEVESTNTWLRNAPTPEHGTTVVARTQTAGRGQRGNSWESEPGMNLTFSMLLRPQNIHAANQFAISRAVAIAITDCLGHWLGIPDQIRIKWPNDIYVDDRKICGILIENNLQGQTIERSIVGIGLNVNQRQFLSDAPNPISMSVIADVEFDLEMLLQDLVNTILSHFNAEDASGGIASRREYFERLWRADGFYPYTDADGQFEARIVDIDPMGFITLLRDDGSSRAYAFKEVAAVL